MVGIMFRSSAVTAEALSEQKGLRKGSDLLCLLFSRVL